MKTNLSSCCNAEVIAKENARPFCFKCGRWCDLASPEVIEKVESGTKKLYTDEGAVKLIIEKIKNTKFPIGERKWCEKCANNIIEFLNKGTE